MQPGTTSSRETSFHTLAVERRGAVEWLTLNRPERLNAFDLRMAGELTRYFDDLRHEASVRVVVLRGAGRAFCAGVDLAAPPEPGVQLGPVSIYRAQRRYADMILAMRRAPQPIIGLLHGAVAGGGFALALACDLRLAATDLKIRGAFLRVGLTACDIGTSYLLPRLIGKAAASELLMTGRTVDAERALRLGLVLGVSPLEALQAEATQLCDELLVSAPLALAMTKQALELNADAPSLEAAIALEDRQQALAASSKDFLEGVQAFVERRPPNFIGS